MSAPLDRRTFTKTMAVALAGAAVPAVQRAEDAPAESRAHRASPGASAPPTPKGRSRMWRALASTATNRSATCSRPGRPRAGWTRCWKPARLPLRSAVLPGEPHRSGRPEGRSGQDRALGGTDQEMRRHGRGDRPEQRQEARVGVRRSPGGYRRRAERHRQGARRRRRGRRPAPAHGHVRGDARRDLRGDGSGEDTLREVRARHRPAAEGGSDPREGGEGLPARRPSRASEGLRRRGALPRILSARAGEGGSGWRSSTCWRARATT